MTDFSSNPDEVFVKNAIEAAIKIAAIFLLLMWCYQIISPFVTPVLWGIILAVALFPFFLLFKRGLGERGKLAAVLMTLIVLACLIIPTVMLSTSMVKSARGLAQDVENGTIEVPPPPASVATWPVVGKSIYQAWDLAATNLEAAMNKFAPQFKQIGKILLSAAAGVGGAILQFIIAIIIAGVLVANACS